MKISGQGVKAFYVKFTVLYFLEGASATWHQASLLQPLGLPEQSSSRLFNAVTTHYFRRSKDYFSGALVTPVLFNLIGNCTYICIRKF